MSSCGTGPSPIAEWSKALQLSTRRFLPLPGVRVYICDKVAGDFGLVCSIPRILFLAVNFLS